MKLEKHEFSVVLEAETAFEQECLNHIASQGPLTAKFSDTWNRKGKLILEFRDPKVWN